MKLTNACCLLVTIIAINAPAQTLVQTFEVGEDTSNWGADWVAPGSFDANATGFMNPLVGGNQAGQASTQQGQEAHRDFRNNTAGVDVEAAAYEISLLLQMDLNPGGASPASGNFYIIDGTFGEYAAAIRLNYTEGNMSALEAVDGSSWEALDVDLAVGVPYYFRFIVDPVAATYSATVSQLNALGVVQSTATLTGLAITGNALNNHNNGQLLFHVDTSSTYVIYAVDNIRVSNIIPEPASAALVLMALAVFGVINQRRTLLAENAR
jgi:hypothetical protein